eukprot:490841-Alexandrium_andersonii.AAC.1
MLDSVGTADTHTHTTARGSPSVQAPSKVRVHVRPETSPFVLPREVVDAPGARNQVAGQPDQRRPIRRGRARHAPA